MSSFTFEIVSNRMIARCRFAHCDSTKHLFKANEDFGSQWVCEGCGRYTFIKDHVHKPKWEVMVDGDNSMQ